MEDEHIGDCPELIPKYDFCPDSEWWKEGISYSDAADRLGSVPSSPSSLLTREFNERADRWAKETGIQSSPVIRFMHKDYQSIMARGKEVIPLILNRMKQKPDDWFWALQHIANHDAAAGADGFDGAVAAWLRWGKDNGYISE